MRQRRAPRRPPPTARVARVGRRELARSWRRRAAGDPHPVADQPAAHPRPRSRSLAGRGDRNDGPPGRCCSTGARRAAASSSMSPAISSNCCCRCCAAGRAGGADRLLPRRDDGDRRRQPGSECERVVTLAAPWQFARYPGPSRCGAAGHVAPFASVRAEPRRLADGGAAGRLLVARPGADGRASSPKFGRARSRKAPRRARFIALEDWANEGEPLPYPAARELIEDLFGRDLPGAGEWTIGGRAVTDDSPRRCSISPPSATASLPPSTAPAGETVGIPSGHVGMIVGSARTQLLRTAGGASSTPLAADRHLRLSGRADAPVAQLDRALPSEGRGHRFESCRVRHSLTRCDRLRHAVGAVERPRRIGPQLQARRQLCQART